MKYTQEQIDYLKSNPFVQLICAVTGTPVEDMLSKGELHIEKDEPEVKGTPKEDNGHVQDLYPTYPLDYNEFEDLIFQLKSLYSDVYQLEDLGIDFFSTNIGERIKYLINSLITYVYDDKIAQYFAAVNFYEDDVHDIIDNLITKMRKHE